ncbi:YdbL family protein [bacterium]|nr:YdbL family protein [bacterium]
MRTLPKLLLGIVILGAVSFATTGCGGSLFNVDLFVVGEQTSLEKQVLGTYDSLGENLLIYSSVRGVSEDGSLKTPPPSTESQQATYMAMRNREYNRGDIEGILREGIAGEANDGLLALRDEEAGAVIADLTRDEVERVVDEENADRQTILDRLVQTTPGVDESSRGEVAWIFAGLNHDLAPDGSWVQSRDGEWVRK